MIHRTGNPILITGSHRSGSTFVGKMLSLHPSIGYIQEPFNVQFGIEGIKNEFPYIYKGMEDEEIYNNLVQDILHGKARYKKSTFKTSDSVINSIGKLLINNYGNLCYKKAVYNPQVNRFLLKDPMACLSSEWLHRKFKMDVVVLIRHPAAFVGSLKRLDWRFDWSNFTNQTALVNNYLNIYMKEVNTEGQSIVDEGIILWNCIYSVLFEYLERNPNMIAMRHEDISADPSNQFKKLYNKLGIPFTNKIEEKIMGFTNDKNPTDPINNEAHTLKRNSKSNIKRWKNILTDKEIQKIKNETMQLASNYYSEHDW